MRAGPFLGTVPDRADGRVGIEGPEGPPDLASALSEESAVPPSVIGPIRGRDLLAERGGVLGVQVDLTVGAVEREPDGLLGRAAGQVVFQDDACFLDHIVTFPRSTVPAPYRGQYLVTVSSAAGQAHTGEVPRPARPVFPMVGSASDQLEPSAPT